MSGKSEPTTPQHKYITNWHDSFVSYIGSLLGVVAGLMARPEAMGGKRQIQGIHRTILETWVVLGISR